MLENSMGETFKVVSLGECDERLADGLSLRRSTSHSTHEAVRHAHGFHQVTLLLSSPGHVEWHMGEDQAYSGRPAAGDVVICPAHVPTLVRWDRPFDSVSVQISTALLDRVAGRAGRKTSTLRPTAMRRDDFVGTIARKLAEEGGDDRGLLAESLGTALAIHLLREYAEEGGPVRGEARLSHDDLRRVTDYIESHLADELCLGRLAALAELSPHHFLRCFRASTGATPHQYIIGRRVERARELLLGGSGITEAAFAVGFSSQSHLHQHVRRLLGVTPGELARGAGFD
jgi:AraC family transcriptional regulator